MIESPHIWKCQKCREYYSAYSRPLTRCPLCRHVNQPLQEHFFSCPDIRDLPEGSPLSEHEYYLYLNNCDVEEEFRLRWEAYQISRRLIRGGDNTNDDSRFKNMKRLFEMLRTESPSTSTPASDLNYETSLLREMGLFQQCINLSNTIDLQYWSEGVLINYVLSKHQISFPYEKMPPQFHEEADSIRVLATDAYTKRRDLWELQLNEFTNSIRSVDSEKSGCLLLLLGIIFSIFISYITIWYYGLIIAFICFIIWGSAESGEDKMKKMLSEWRRKNPEPKPPTIRYAPIQGVI